MPTTRIGKQVTKQVEAGEVPKDVTMTEVGGNRR